MSQKEGIKHLIQCHCVLPQYRGRKDPVFHKFVVFSVQDETGDVIPKIVRCNNCDVTHKVTDFCKSEIIHGSENISSVITIDEIKNHLGERLSNILEGNNCDLPTWESVSFIIDNEMWGDHVTISKTKMSDSTQVKIIKIIGIDRFKVETHLRQDDVTGGSSLI